MSHKSFVQIGDRLVSVTTDYIYPPIPYRGNDWRACYSADQSDNPDCGWGATAEDAIDDLVRSYDYEDVLPSFIEMYVIDLFYARMHWQAIERSYQEVK